MFRGNRDSFWIEQNAERRHHGIEIQQGLALPHQHDVGIRCQHRLVFFQGEQHLGHNFARGQIANQPELRRQAELAIHRATGLRGNANRLPALAGHEYRFDRRGASRGLVFADGQRKQIAHRPVL